MHQAQQRAGWRGIGHAAKDTGSAPSPTRAARCHRGLTRVLRYTDGMTDAAPSTLTLRSPRHWPARLGVPWR
jgi:hypothetical protein